MLLKFLRKVFLFQDRGLYLVACGVLLQSRTVCTDFLWTIIGKTCLLFLLHTLLLSKPNMVSQSYRCFLPNFPPSVPATWTHVAVNETYHLLLLPCCQDIWRISLSSYHCLLKVFSGVLEGVNFFFSLGFFFFFFLCTLFIVCLFVVWFGLDCAFILAHTSVCFRLKLQSFIWIWRNVESQVSWFKINSLYSRGCYKELASFFSPPAFLWLLSDCCFSIFVLYAPLPLSSLM